MAEPLFPRCSRCPDRAYHPEEVHTDPRAAEREAARHALAGDRKGARDMLIQARLLRARRARRSTS